MDWDSTGSGTNGYTRRRLLSSMAIGTAATVFPASVKALDMEAAAAGAERMATTDPTGLVDLTIAAPRLELAVGLHSYPPSYDVVDVADSLRPGDRLVLLIGHDARFDRFDALHYDLTGEEHSEGAVAVFTDGAGRSLADYASGTHWTYAYVERGGKSSAHSNTVLHGEAEARNPQWSFAKAIDVAPKGTSATGPIRPTGFNVGLPISVSNGEYRIDSGSGFGPWTAEAGLIYPGDSLDHRHTNAAAMLSEVTSAVTIGDVTEPFMSRTHADLSAAMWNALDKSNAVALSNANLTATANYPSGIGSVRATFGRTGGERSRFTATVNYGGNNVYVGFCYADAPLDAVPGRHNGKGVSLHAALGGWEVYSGGALVAFNYSGGGADGDVLGVERVGMTLTFKRNGATLWSGPMPAGAGKIYGFFAADGSTTVCNADFTGY
ncbi:MAG: hypothetical protein JF595_10220 [Sphingomonadales bacterium]|nr:hypothetical protein [Sphingomonadales bacterium]